MTLPLDFRLPAWLFLPERFDTLRSSWYEANGSNDSENQGNQRHIVRAFINNRGGNGNTRTDQAKLKKLQAQAEVMLAKKAQTAVDKIRALMLEHGLTTADIEAKAKVTREGKALRKGASSNGNVVVDVKAKGAPKNGCNMEWSRARASVDC